MYLCVLYSGGMLSIGLLVDLFLCFAICFITSIFEFSFLHVQDKTPPWDSHTPVLLQCILTTSSGFSFASIPVADYLATNQIVHMIGFCVSYFIFYSFISCCRWEQCTMKQASPATAGEYIAFFEPAQTPVTATLIPDRNIKGARQHSPPRGGDRYVCFPSGCVKGRVRQTERGTEG